MNKIKAAIVGATGYAGQELVRLILQHPNVNLRFATSKSYIDKKYENVYENFYNLTDIVCSEDELEQLADEVDVIFIALPHGIASGKVNENILKKVKIIDLGADFRLNDVDTYESWYNTPHNNQETLSQAIYGLCEWNREKIKTTNLVANPGCFTTCSILSLAPAIKDNTIEEDSIIIDAKSGVSGAGRSLNLGIHFAECNESIKAYKVAGHRHTPEIEQELSILSGKNITLSFTPHLVPMNRGILTTCYAKLKADFDYQEIRKSYEKYYQNEHFIRLLPEGVFPETRWVKGSNFIDIGFAIDKRTNRLIVIGALDNLIKGAAGQAIQNMNLLFGLEETAGINSIPIFPA
jgi:N-acetyl-gamma-glutamyl-phosphate reductase